MRRHPAAAAVLCLAGAVLVLVAAGRSWVSVVTPAGLADAGTVSHTGTDLAPALPVLGLIGLAGAVAMLVSGRTLVGCLFAAGAQAVPATEPA